MHDNLGQANYDHERDEFLKSMGHIIYRIDNESVISYVEVMLEDLERFIQDMIK